ncbi:MAG TPA: hypothetical protein DEH78_19665, partial [Solibacterales bacterium]|nr:hypothetical protein [Bryobacterales bacterium]
MNLFAGPSGEPNGIGALLTAGVFFSRPLAFSLPEGKILEATCQEVLRGPRKVTKSGKTTEPYQKAFADRRRDPDGKREAILRTAVEMFHNRGYASTSMNEIAEKLHITKPALYHYFRNKEDILLECYRWGCILIREFLDEIANKGGRGLE